MAVASGTGAHVGEGSGEGLRVGARTVRVKVGADLAVEVGRTVLVGCRVAGTREATTVEACRVAVAEISPVIVF